MNSHPKITRALTLVLFSFVPYLLSAQVEPNEPDSELVDRMHDKLAAVGLIKFAVISGKLEDAREPATFIADQQTVAGMPDNFGPYIAQMRTYARHIIEANDLHAAASSVSNLGKTCGACHTANDVQLEFGFDQLPRQDVEDVVTHMQRHQWATDRMWEGLVGPSDAAWDRGVDMLIDVPLLPSDVTTRIEHETQLDETVRRIHTLGGMGANTKTADARSALYGEVLSLCADCHTLLDRGPGH